MPHDPHDGLTTVRPTATVAHATSVSLLVSRVRHIAVPSVRELLRPSASSNSRRKLVSYAMSSSTFKSGAPTSSGSGGS